MMMKMIKITQLIYKDLMMKMKKMTKLLDDDDDDDDFSIPHIKVVEY